MIRAWRSIQTFLKDERGASSTEYAIFIALVIVIGAVTVSFMGDRVSDLFAEGSEGWQSDGWRRVLVPDEKLSFAQSQ